MLAEIGLPPTHQMPRDLWRWTVAVSDIADLSTSAKLTKLGLPVPRPSWRSWPHFQAIDEALHIEGCCGEPKVYLRP